MSVLPFLKWPGGKRWFIANHSTLLPTTFGRYFEPFLGGGSVFFHLQPKRSILTDCNAELIDVYRTVAWRRKRLEGLLRQQQIKHGKRNYYRVRDHVPIDSVERAARTLYLNRTCFNGMYRVNRAGEFNVPKGTKSAVLLDTDDFATTARLLRRAKIYVSDFEAPIDEAKCGDLVFADPPYTVRHNNNGFVKYNETLFSWADQERLASTLTRAARRGVKVVATNADHDELRVLYRQPSFCLTVVERYSSISSDPTTRRAYRELIIRANCD